MAQQSIRASLRVALALAFLAPLAAFAPHARAERSCKYVKRLNEELNCGLVSRDDDDDDYDSRRPRKADETKDFALNKSFGPTECKTSAAAKDAMKEFKTECQVWLKEQRGDLKSKFQTGSCADKAEDCSVGGITGKAYTVQGIVHYTNGK